MTGGPHDKKIGDMNGWTVALFKVQLVITPILMTGLLGLGTWIVSSVNELGRNQAVIQTQLHNNANSMYTRDAARADMLILQKEIMADVADEYPPDYWTELIRANAKRLDQLDAKRDAANK